MNNFLKTKIVVTIGPATDSESQLKALVAAGARIFRLNTSHGTAKEHLSSIVKIRKVGKSLGCNLPILLDLQGPKIRVGTLEEPLFLKKGESLELLLGKDCAEQGIVPVPFKGLAADLKKKDKLLLDDGRIALEVKVVDKKRIQTKVLTDGVLSSRKGINLPGSTNSLPGVTIKDLEYIEFAVKNNIDFIALSFVRTAADVLTAKKKLKSLRAQIPIIAKIEKPQAVDNIDEVIDVSDGLMVARGDLGIEVSLEQVPIVQKTLIQKANRAQKPVIVATQMLESMIENPIPTRAEASDVANAIFDGADAVMLSGETSVGKYPIAAVEMMARVATEVEETREGVHYDVQLKTEIDRTFDHHQFSKQITALFAQFPIKAIVVCTQDGRSARMVSSARVDVPIIAICSDSNVGRRLNLLWGIWPVTGKKFARFDEKYLLAVDDILKNKIGFKKGVQVVVTTGLPFLLEDRTSFMRLHRVG